MSGIGEVRNGSESQATSELSALRGKRRSAGVGNRWKADPRPCILSGAVWLYRRDVKERVEEPDERRTCTVENGNGSSIEETIRDIEEQERCAMLAGDSAAIETFWDPELLINGPHGALLVGRDATLNMVKEKIIDFRRFDRTIECIQTAGAVAVTMGSETIEQKRGPQAGEVIERRFTNVWMLQDGNWRLRFRHANVTPARPQVLTREG